MPKNWSVPSVPSRVVLAIALDSHGHTVGSAFGTLAVGGPATYRCSSGSRGR